MKYAIAIGHYQADDYPLATAMTEWADYGFDAIMIMPYQMMRLSAAEVADVKAVIRDRRLTTTVHACFDGEQHPAGLTPRKLAFILDLLGESLYSITFDAASTQTSCGTFFNFARMLPVLRHTMQATAGTPVYFGLEDFPLDDAALARYGPQMEDLPACERYAMLADLGHMNVRLRSHPYFAGQSVADYFGRTRRKIVEIHIHDNDGTRDAHAHPGDGNIDYPTVAAALKQAGFDGVCTMEVSPDAMKLTMEQSKPRTIEAMRRWRKIWLS